MIKDFLEKFRDLMNRPVPRDKAMLYISLEATILFAIIDILFTYKFGVFVCTSKEFRCVMIAEGLLLFYCWFNYLIFRK